MIAHLGIVFTEMGDDYLKATMPVDHRTLQPFGLLHGGASVVLAETLGCTAASCCVDLEKQICVGIEINANHIRQAHKGRVVTGMARPIHIGFKIQVWRIEINDDNDRLICESRLTIAVLEKDLS